MFFIIICFAQLADYQLKTYFWVETFFTDLLQDLIPATGSLPLHLKKPIH